MVVEQVIKTIKKYKMISPGDHIVVGVSGGADSVSLLYILHALQDRLNLRLTVAHLDHMLRGEEAKREAAFVKGLAATLGVTCALEARDVQAFKKERGLSLQEAAREVRYEFLQDVLKQHSADKIALGHHADDQAETVLMRLLRGASLKGLSGIPPVREGIIIRPLIQSTRKELEGYLKVKNVPFVPDMSAAEPHYLRNKIRHELIPLLKKEYTPQIVPALTRMADTARQDEEVLDIELTRIAEACMVKSNDEIRCSIDAIKKYNAALYGRLVRKIIHDLKGDTRSVTFQHIEAICHLLSGKGPSRKVQLPGGCCAWREYDSLVFTLRERTAAEFFYAFDAIPETCSIDQLGLTLFFSVEHKPLNESVFYNRDRRVAFFNYGEVRAPVVIRSWREGDRFYPLGLGGCKKIKDFFSDQKVPVRERHRVPILLFNNNVAWICGYRPDERFKVTGESPNVLTVRIK
ncbi:MAG: tRNA lysidine(34) synthetase TilS [Pseudomonadota bacterium]